MASEEGPSGDNSLLWKMFSIISWFAHPDLSQSMTEDPAKHKYAVTAKSVGGGSTILPTLAAL